MSISASHAQADSSRSLETVVVTGQYKPQSVKNSVYNVRVIGRERIEKQSATKLQDILATELNIRFAQDLATGGSNISMLGLSGQNVKILIDGMPMVGRQGTSNEININQIDVNTIERIEIVEGPMSVVYGADALAGVINIITKKAGKSAIGVTARIQEESIGKEYGIDQGIHNQSVGLSSGIKNWSFSAGYSHNYFGGWKGDTTGRELTWHKKVQHLGNGSIGWKNDRYSVQYRIDGLDEVITNPGNFLQYQQATGDTLANDQEYITKRLMQQLQATMKANENLSFLLQGSFTNFSRQVYSTTVSQKTGAVRLNTAPGAQSLDKFTGLTVRGTAVYRLNKKVSFQPGIDINTETGEGERLKAGKNAIQDYAFFVSSEITAPAWLSIRPGLRFEYNSVYQAPPVIPSLNVKLALPLDFELRLAYANGFRAPSLRELYFNFFDANHQIIGNPDLKAETSNSFTGSLIWKKKLSNENIFSASLNGFYNNVSNLIDYGASPADPNVFMYINVHKYKSKGGTLNLKFQDRHWDISLGGGYTGRYNEMIETNKDLPEFQWSPEVNSTIGYSFPKAGVGINFYYKFTGALPFYQYDTNGQDIRLAQTDGYNWADLTVNKKLFGILQVNAGIRNLFDVKMVNNTAVANGAHSTTGARPIGYGRSYFAGIIFNWNKK